MTKSTIIAEIMFEADLTKCKATRLYNRYAQSNALAELEKAIMAHTIKEAICR